MVGAALAITSGPARDLPLLTHEGHPEQEARHPEPCGNALGRAPAPQMFDDACDHLTRAIGKSSKEWQQAEDFKKPAKAHFFQCLPLMIRPRPRLI